jgi:lysophospholipase L1-like esterase
MAHTNILSRRFNREFINLGFSGNALLDYEIADIIADVDASLYILDFVPNASVKEMKEKTERFYSIIRTRRPETPIIFVEDPLFTHIRFDQRIAKEVKNKNETINQIVESLKKAGDQHILLVSSLEMIGADNEATVDGIHFTDLGFMRYSDMLSPIIEEIISNSSCMPTLQARKILLSRLLEK